MALIRDAWDQNVGVGGLDEMQSSLRGVKSRLQTWERDVFGSVKKSLAALHRELEMERGRLIGCGPSRKEKQLMARITELLSREEVMEKQRARMDWLRDGDRNTALFQAKSRARAKRNAITSLIQEDCSVVVSQEDIEETASKFYQDLFSTQNELQPELILQHVSRKITDEMCGGINPYTLTARLGPEGLAHYETSSRFGPTAWSFAQGNKTWKSSRILVG
jgi:hypothetical protein